MSRRAEHRRAGSEAARACLTVSDAHMINAMRCLPTDHPSRGLRKHKNKPLRPRMAFPILTAPEQAWRYLRIIRRCPEAQRVSRWLTTHPGPKSRCTPEMLILAMFLAAEIKGRYLRSDLCSIINGLDAVILHHLGACDNKRFKVISYSTVQSQTQRLEDSPFGDLFIKCGNNTDGNDDTDGGDASDEAGADEGLMRFNMGLLLASIPKRALKKFKEVAKEVTLDATAFPTYARVRDYRLQESVDAAIRAAIKRGDPDPVPKGVILGVDGKLQRCKYDPAARGAYRSASAETNHKSGYFTGYFVTTLCASRGYRYDSNSGTLRLGYDIAPYILALSCDPATDNRAPVARDLIGCLQQALCGLRAVTGDREFSVRPSLVEAVHRLGIAFIMDYPKPATQKRHLVTVGQREEQLYQFCGNFYPLCTPKNLLEPPDPNLTEEESLDRAEQLAKYRYVPNGPPDKNGTIQMMCGQCAGHIRYAANTRMGKYRHGNHPAPSLGPPFDQQWCCSGSINIRVEDLNQWQPVPWGTRAHKQLYAAGRNRIENSYNIVKKDGGLNYKSCQAPLVPAHNMAALALAVAANAAFADGDPLADPTPDDMPKAELSLFCVLPAFHDTHNAPKAAPPTRAPP